MRYLILPMLLLPLAASAAPAAPAATPAAANAGATSSAQQALALKYFQVAGIEQMYGDRQQMEEMFNQQLQMVEQTMAPRVDAVVAANLHEVLQNIKPSLGNIITQNLARMQPEMVQIIARTYSAEELQALIAFYETPMGKSVVSKNPALLGSITGVVNKYTVVMMQDVEKILRQEVQALIARKGAPPKGK